MKNIILIPVADLTIDPSLVFTTVDEVDTPVKFQFIKMAGGRDHNGKCLVLSHSSGDLAQAIVDSGLSWTILNTGLNITGSEALDWIADKQDVDGEGLPVGLPYRPLTVPPLTVWMGDAPWAIA